MTSAMASSPQSRQSESSSIDPLAMLASAAERPRPSPPQDRDTANIMASAFSGAATVETSLGSVKASSTTTLTTKPAIASLEDDSATTESSHSIDPTTTAAAGPQPNGQRSREARQNNHKATTTSLTASGATDNNTDRASEPRDSNDDDEEADEFEADLQRALAGKQQAATTESSKRTDSVLQPQTHLTESLVVAKDNDAAAAAGIAQQTSTANPNIVIRHGRQLTCSSADPSLRSAASSVSQPEPRKRKPRKDKGIKRDGTAAAAAAARASKKQKSNVMAETHDEPARTSHAAVPWYESGIVDDDSDTDWSMVDAEPYILYL